MLSFFEECIIIAFQAPARFQKKRWCLEYYFPLRSILAVAAVAHFVKNSFFGTLWLFNIAMENGPFTDDFPSYKPPFIMDFPVRYVK